MITEARLLGERLLEKGWTITTAESCTGGLVAASITDIAGSSDWFEQGFVTYADAAKQRWLGVPETLLKQFGAVSEQVVQAMAKGALQSGADLAIATSGIAGPGGGTAEKPVGLVWFAWADADRCLCSKQYFSGDRQQVREAAVRFALSGALEFLTV